MTRGTHVNSPRRMFEPADGGTRSSPPEPHDLQRTLLAWYAEHARQLPWRDTPDPYQVLVSEIMLQQTQVDRVVPKFHAFLSQFPTLEQLAVAPVADVIRAWHGLGYNRRAVRLWEIARQVVELHSGVLPRDLPTLLALKGIGAYTARAVASFAYHDDVATVDTNVRRVIRRTRDGLGAPAVSDQVAQQQADALLPAGQSAAWNQALMDLGATICTAQRPRCPVCPLGNLCTAYAEYRASGLPDRAHFFAGQERSASRTSREQPFTGSRRFFRGKIVSALRALPTGAALPLPALGRAIKEEFTPYEAAWLGDLVHGLADDGLIEIRDAASSGESMISLPGHAGAPRTSHPATESDASGHQQRLWSDGEPNG